MTTPTPDAGDLTDETLAKLRNIYAGGSRPAERWVCLALAELSRRRSDPIHTALDAWLTDRTIEGHRAFWRMIDLAREYQRVSGGTET